MNAGFEDCRILFELFLKTSHQKQFTSDIIESFSSIRYNDAAAICDLAMYNYIEMRSNVIDPRYIIRKRVEGILHKWFPSRFIPLYTMVSFSNIPYSEVIQKWNRQTKWIQRAGAFVVGATFIASLALSFKFLSSKFALRRICYVVGRGIVIVTKSSAE